MRGDAERCDAESQAFWAWLPPSRKASFFAKATKDKSKDRQENGASGIENVDIAASRMGAGRPDDFDFRLGGDRVKRRCRLRLNFTRSPPICHHDVTLGSRYEVLAFNTLDIRNHIFPFACGAQCYQEE